MSLFPRLPSSQRMPGQGKCNQQIEVLEHQGTVFQGLDVRGRSGQCWKQYSRHPLAAALHPYLLRKKRHIVRRNSRSGDLQRDLSTHGQTAKKAVTACDVSRIGGDVVTLMNTMQQIMARLEMTETRDECFSLVVYGTVVEKRLSSLQVHTLHPSKYFMLNFLRKDGRKWKTTNMSCCTSQCYAETIHDLISRTKLIGEGTSSNAERTRTLKYQP
jgi:hypothetical protein